MKKIFQVIGLLSLLFLSFFYTEQTAKMVKSYDELLIRITDEANNKIEPLNALIKDNTIIPGISGKEININDSYYNMKKIGYYDSNLLVYNNIKPNISLYDNYNKYIIKGNSMNKKVSIIFKVDKDISKIIDIVDEEQIKTNFFIDGTWFESNNEQIMNLINSGHNIGNMGYNKDYTNSNFIWINNIISKVGKQKYNYCYTEVENDNTLNICSMHQSFIIKPNIVLDKNPLIKLKKELVAGSIISININDQTIEQLPLIIRYIKSKDYKIVNLVELLKE